MTCPRCRQPKECKWYVLKYGETTRWARQVCVDCFPPEVLDAARWVERTGWSFRAGKLEGNA